LKGMLVLAAVVTAGLADAAHAAEAIDMLTKIDAAAHTVTLADGSVYTFPARVDLSQLRIGERVTVMYTTDDRTGQNNATIIFQDQ
jgi:hypothetical protein